MKILEEITDTFKILLFDFYNNKKYGSVEMEVKFEAGNVVSVKKKPSESILDSKTKAIKLS